MEKKKQIEELAELIDELNRDVIIGYKPMKNGMIADIVKGRTAEEKAEALMEAGIGDVKVAERRAEVAEKALERTVVELLITQGYSALMAVIRAKEFFIPEAIKQAQKDLSEDEE